MKLAKVGNGCFLSPLQELQKAKKIPPMQTISTATRVNVGFARQIDLMGQQRYMQLDTTNKQQASFLWRGLLMTEVCQGLTGPVFILPTVANAHRIEIQED